MRPIAIRPEYERQGTLRKGTRLVAVQNLCATVMPHNPVFPIRLTGHRTRPNLSVAPDMPFQGKVIASAGQTGSGPAGSVTQRRQVTTQPAYPALAPYGSAI